jgi:hypothetical protein
LAGGVPVEFLNDEQVAAYGRCSSSPPVEVLERLAWFDDADRELIAVRRGLGNRLGFAVQLATVRLLGTFLSDPTDVPTGVVEFVAAQIGIEVALFKGYSARPKTRRASVEDWVNVRVSGLEQQWSAR